jgi:Ser/Thr protein kinase RdoA (MazF antagonist)
MMRRDIDAARAADIVSGVAADRGFDGQPVLLRSGMNLVFRVGDVVLRVAPEDVDGQAHVELAQRLLEAGLPVVRPLDDAVVLEGFVVTLWEHIDQPGHASLDYQQLGAAIARLHRLDPRQLPPRLSLPWCGEADWLQLESVYDRAAATGVVDREELAVLARECAALADWQQQARAEPAVVCHGDVHPQNVLMRSDGEVAILDWDGLCLGPAAWDHAPLLTWEERWGGQAGTYEAFAAGYGTDLHGSPVARLLARVRLLAPTLNKIVQGAADAERAAEARRRMRYWRGDPHAPPWRPQ